jgi:flagellin-specific chaperone FliS
MSVAVHMFSPDEGASIAASDVPQSLSRVLLDGALEHLDAARACMEHGQSPHRDVRRALLRIRELPATLELPPDETLATSIAELCRYMCRKLGTIDPTTASGTIAATCDLLCEIRCAWLTPVDLRTGESNVRRL